MHPAPLARFYLHGMPPGRHSLFAANECGLRARRPFMQARAAALRDPGERRTISAMAEWWSIEVLHGEFSAFRWQEQHDDALVEAALTNGAIDGSWHADRWGVVFEICFETEQQWERFRGLAAVHAALDGVPDPVNGLLVYRGRGGAAGTREPRRPKPAPSAEAISLPEPQAVQLDLTGTSQLDLARVGTAEA
jgi:hypothetical protein